MTLLIIEALRFIVKMLSIINVVCKMDKRILVLYEVFTTTPCSSRCCVQHSAVSILPAHAAVFYKKFGKYVFLFLIIVSYPISRFTMHYTCTRIFPLTTHLIRVCTKYHSHYPFFIVIITSNNLNKNSKVIRAGRFIIIFV